MVLSFGRAEVDGQVCILGSPEEEVAASTWQNPSAAVGRVEEEGGCCSRGWVTCEVEVGIEPMSWNAGVGYRQYGSCWMIVLPRHQL